MTNDLNIIKMKKKYNRIFQKVSISFPLAEEIPSYAHNISLEKLERAVIGAL
jgi:hypothetical protein